MKIACIQQQARAVWEYEQVLSDIFSLLDEAGKAGADLAILPECAYPAYFLGLDEDSLKASMARIDELLARVAEAAKCYSMHICLGLAYPDQGRLYNAALMFDDAGEIIGRASKSNLWHFDGRWFDPGCGFEAFDSKLGRLGIMICADGRIPEIARILKLQGAKLILDPVNLVASASEPKALMNQQYAFILPVRAMENKTWLVASNKCGVEANCATYLGRSMIISPEGQIVADMPPDAPGVLYYDVDLDASGELPERTPAHYAAMAEPTETLPIYAKMQKAMTPAESEIMVSAVQFRSETAADYLARAKAYIRAGEMAESRLIFLPRLSLDTDIAALAEALRGAIREDSVVALSCGVDTVRGVCFGAEGVLGVWEKGAAPKVVETARGGLAMLFDEEPIYTPELPRTAMLLGAEILLWADNENRPMNLKVTQTRAAENKMFVMRTSNAADDVSNVVNPGGAVAASVFRGADQAAGGLIFRFEGLAKSVITGTNIVMGRRPECYEELVK